MASKGANNNNIYLCICIYNLHMLSHVMTPIGVIIACILYADGGTISADTPEDLQLTPEILEDFCNKHSLFMRDREVPDSKKKIIKASRI